MPPILVFIIYVFIAIGAYLIVDALAGLLRVVRGEDEEAVNRRLQRQSLRVRDGSGEIHSILRPSSPGGEWREYIPFYPRFLRLIDTSGVDTTPQRALVLMSIIAFVAFLLSALLLPLIVVPLSFIIAPVIGIGSVILYLMKARSSRVRKFEEQLPDALDLIIRSLKIGHPLSGAMSVVGRELPEPTRSEFAAAFDKVSYGLDIPTAFQEMAERVPVQDLGYVAMAVQIQQESGGNLVESLSKLSAVIRGRFRMFRKVKALTAEGRFSAWFLSVFPFVLILLVQLIKPDYYTQVMDIPVFPYLVVATIFLLTINVIAMRIITTIKV